ncbi:NADH-quinone oxidoreductase subunit N [bacterium]|nr:MAG: NADH-quinone oxidoreductase subunit N [bacterium]
MTFQMSDISLITPEIVLTLTALLVLLVEAFRPGAGRSDTTWLSIIGVLVAAAFALGQFGEKKLGFSGMLSIDSYSAFFKLIFCSIGLLCFLISDGFMKSEEYEHGEFHALMLMSMTGMMLMASSNHLLMMFLGLETMSIAIYALAGYMRTKEGMESSFKYFLLGGASSAFLLYGIALLYASTGTTQIDLLFNHFAAQGGMTHSPMALAGIALIAGGFAFKVAAFPFHVWTPDVYQGAPTPVTAFMATGVKAAAFAAFFRIFLVAFPASVESWSGALWIIAVLTMTMGNLAALVQKDIKRMLAYSSIAHAGYLLVAMVTATADAGTGLLFYLFSYAFMNIGAFACVIMLGRKGDQRTTLDDYAGIGFKKPLLAAALTVFMFSMAGIPPTAGFIGKFLIFKAAIKQGYIWLAVLGVLNSAASVYYYLRVLVYMYFKEPGEKADEPLRAGGLIALATTIAVVVILLLGMVPGAMVELAQAAASKF